MTIRKIEIERISLTSSKPFQTVVAALEAAVRHPDMVEFTKATSGARTFAELVSAVHGGLGRTDLMVFMELDLGAILRKETGDRCDSGASRSSKFYVKSRNLPENARTTGSQ